MTKPAVTDDLPVVKAKRRRVQVVAYLEEFGQTWRLVRPNQILANRVVGGDGTSLNMGEFNAYFADHVHPEERESFLTAAAADPTMNIEELMALMRRMSDAVYAGVESEDEDDDVIEASATEQ